MKKYFLIFLVFSFSAKNMAQDNHLNLLVGTYTKSCDSKGIYVYDFDALTGNFILKNTSESTVNPSFLSISENKKMIYTVNENDLESTVSSYEFNAKLGNLKFINRQDSKGANPCHIINDSKNVIVANYSGGNISVFGKNYNGSLTSAKQVISHYGKGLNPKRQESPHVHMVQFSPDKKFVIANDLGTDKIYVYDYYPNAKTKILSIKDSISVKSGSGPRHLTFSKNGKFAYLIQELDGSLTVFGYKNGNFAKLQETKVIKDDFVGDISAADIHISPDGKFLYATNRGTANDISCFEILENGLLQYKNTTSTLGKGPRNFAIDPSGNFLLVAHQYTNTVVVFNIDKTTGTLTDTGKKIELCSPVCLIFSK
jgi:6-phosphogluconolactonase